MRKIMLRDYKIIVLPFDKKINDLTEREAKDFFNWFLNITPKRLNILKETIRKYDKRIAVKLNYSPNSLLYLGTWFSKNVKARKRTKQEIKREQATLVQFPGVKAEDWTLTEETFSLCFDVGIYFASIFLKRFKTIEWTYITKQKNNIDRNWPLLRGFRVNMNPIQLIITSIYGILDGTYDTKHLRKLYSIWINELKKR